jgi:hypothetical protein
VKAREEEGSLGTCERSNPGKDLGVRSALAASCAFPPDRLGEDTWNNNNMTQIKQGPKKPFMDCKIYWKDKSKGVIGKVERGDQIEKKITICNIKRQKGVEQTSHIRK